MRILISGASGLIGRETAALLSRAGRRVGRLVRPGRELREGDVPWTPGAELDPDALKDVDAVIHLAGQTVAGRWGERQKRAIRESRIEPTTALARSIAASYQHFAKPAVFLSASAIGYYGSRGEEPLTESSAPGNTFLAEICKDWEAATNPARDAGVRVILPRISLVLSTRGGALAKMLPIFRLGLAGKIGDGRQYWSWISLEDLTRSFLFTIENPSFAGPYNAASPMPATNAEFTRAVATVLHRPAIFPMPAFAARAVFRSAADELMLASQKVVPEKLCKAGFEFKDNDLVTTLRRILVSDASDPRKLQVGK